MIAGVNGLSPFILAVFIISPLWLHELGMVMPLAALETAIGFAFASIFALGISLGHPKFAVGSRDKPDRTDLVRQAG